MPIWHAHSLHAHMAYARYVHRCAVLQLIAVEGTLYKPSEPLQLAVQGSWASCLVGMVWSARPTPRVAVSSRDDAAINHPTARTDYPRRLGRRIAPRNGPARKPASVHDLL